MLKLYNFDRSPFGWKVRIVMAEKKVPYTSVEPPPNKDQDPAFGRLNPFRLTPVLELENGKTLYESSIINEYLEEAYPEPAMLPRDPYERARIRMLEDTTDQYFGAAVRAFTMSQFEYTPPYLIRKKADQVDHKGLEEARVKVHQNLSRLEQELQGRTWFGGPIFSLADVALAPVLTGRLKMLGVLPDPKYPGLKAWSERVMARPSYKATIPKADLTIKE